MRPEPIDARLLRAFFVQARGFVAILTEVPFWEGSGDAMVVALVLLEGAVEVDDSPPAGKTRTRVKGVVQGVRLYPGERGGHYRIQCEERGLRFDVSPASSDPVDHLFDPVDYIVLNPPDPRPSLSVGWSREGAA